MATSNTKSAVTASKKLAEYETELKRARTRNYIIGGIVAVFTIFFGMMLSGDRFAGVLSIFGLRPISNVIGGVYADCSDPENQDVSYCQKQRRGADKNWDSVSKSGGRASPFSLGGS